MEFFLKTSSGTLRICDSVSSRICLAKTVSTDMNVLRLVKKKATVKAKCFFFFMYIAYLFYYNEWVIMFFKISYFLSSFQTGCPAIFETKIQGLK